MRGTRQELLRQIVELINTTEALLRATEESTRACNRLRADIARLTRRPKTRRAVRPRRSMRPAPSMAIGPSHLRLVQAALAEGLREDWLRDRGVRPAGTTTLAASQAPPAK
jgi:hypothetical protein